jgi:NhaC family Na+:H+ antiporter
MDSHKFTVKESIGIILMTIVAIGTCLVTGVSMVYGFLTAIAITILLLLKYGASFETVRKTLSEGIWSCKSIYVIIVLMGTTIAVWIASGVVPMLIYYGFRYIEGMNFILASFVILALLSYVLGTAIGTISTIGVALYGIGIGFGIPKEVIIGTLVSGAFIADKISPISGLMNLTIESVGTDYKTYLKEQMKTLSLGIILCLIFYFFLGNRYAVGQLGPSVEAFNKGIVEIFSLSPLLLLFPVMVVVLALRGVTTIKTMTTCVVLGSFVAYFYQGFSLGQIGSWLWFGVHLETGMEAVDSIIKGGGIQPMLEVICIVMSAVALNSLFELGGVFEPVIKGVVGDTKSPGKLMRRTALLSMFLTSITCDQVVGIIVPAKQLRNRYKEAGLKEEQLASVISDSGTILAPIEFWNVNALILMAIFSINPIQYVPYAVLCYSMPLIIMGRGTLMHLKEKGLEKGQYE